MIAGTRHSEDHAAELARARFGKRKANEVQRRGARPLLSQIVEDKEGEEDDNDNGRLSELIGLAEAEFPAVQDDADDDDFLSQAADEVESAYYK